MKAQRVALICENSVEYVDKLLDIWNNGDCAVLLDWRIPFETTYRMMLEAGVQKCFIESRLIENISLTEYPKSCDDCLTGCEDFFEGETVEESQGSNNSAGEKADDAKLSI